jgi:hypothetical protein
LLDAVTIGVPTDAYLEARTAAETAHRCSEPVQTNWQRARPLTCLRGGEFGEESRHRTMERAPPLATAASIVDRRVGSIGPCCMSMRSPVEAGQGC